MHILNLTVHIPGPIAGQRLATLGAKVIKVEPPTGDPLKGYCPKWYKEIHQKQKVIQLNLKNKKDFLRFKRMLHHTDVLITSMRSSALKRLGLDWKSLHQHFPQLCQVAVFGFSPPFENRAGHDLTYQAESGLLTGGLPTTLIADLAGAQETVLQTYLVLLKRQKTKKGNFAFVSLATAARIFAKPMEHELTLPGGPLAGKLPFYNIYQTKDHRYVAVAALEEKFKDELKVAMKNTNLNLKNLKKFFLSKPAAYWQDWALKKNFPLSVF